MITSEQWEVFFAALEETGVVKTAARAADIARRTIYDRIDAAEGAGASPEAVEWLKRYRGAVRASVDTLEAEAFRRAHDGVDEPLIGRVGKDQDGIITTVKKHSDSLLMFLLRARDPARFKDRTATELTGKDGGPVKTENKVICLPVIDPNAPDG